MTLARINRKRLYSICVGSRTTTAHWREYLHLSKLGLVNILDSGREWGHMFGVSSRDVEPTAKGRALAKELILTDRDAWQVAQKHAEHFASGQNRSTCCCGECNEIRNVWRDNGYTWAKPEPVLKAKKVSSRIERRIHSCAIKDES
jgi:hypothetical protein